MKIPSGYAAASSEPPRPYTSAISDVHFTRTVEHECPTPPASPHLRLLPLARRCLQPLASCLRRCTVRLCSGVGDGARFQVTFGSTLRLEAMSDQAEVLVAVVVGLGGGHLLFNVFAPVGESMSVEGPAQRARAAAHATRRATKAAAAGSVHASEQVERRLRQARRPSSVAGSGVARRRVGLCALRCPALRPRAGARPAAPAAPRWSAHGPVGAGAGRGRLAPLSDPGRARARAESANVCSAQNFHLSIE